MIRTPVSCDVMRYVISAYIPHNELTKLQESVVDLWTDPLRTTVRCFKNYHITYIDSITTEIYMRGKCHVRFDQYANYHGVCEQWNEDGALQRDNWHHGIRNGLHAQYRPDGSVYYCVPFHNNEMHGVYTEYDGYGTVRCTKHYHTGKLHGVHEYYVHSVRVLREHYVHGVLHGLRSTWYNNGAVRSVQHYVHGAEHGISVHRNGVGKERCRIWQHGLRVHLQPKMYIIVK